MSINQEQVMCKIINTKGNVISYLLKSIDGLCDPVITKLGSTWLGIHLLVQTPHCTLSDYWLLTLNKIQVWFMEWPFDRSLNQKWFRLCQYSAQFSLATDIMQVLHLVNRITCSSPRFSLTPCSHCSTHNKIFLSICHKRKTKLHPCAFVH